MGRPILSATSSYPQCLHSLESMFGSMYQPLAQGQELVQALAPELESNLDLELGLVRGWRRVELAFLALGTCL